MGFFDGYCGYPEAGDVWISIFVIDAAHQQLGYARQVIAGLSALCSASGWKRIGVGVHLKNWRALRFWQRNGFDHIGTIYGDKEHSPEAFAVITLFKSLEEHPTNNHGGNIMLSATEQYKEQLAQLTENTTREIEALTTAGCTDEANQQKAGRNIYGIIAQLLRSSQDDAALSAQFDKLRQAWQQAKDTAAQYSDHEQVAIEEVKLAALDKAEKLWHSLHKGETV